MSARSRELFGLLPVTLLVTGGFTAVLITRSSQINKVTITYGAFFLDERIGVAAFAAFVLILAGVALAARARRLATVEV